MNDKISPLFMWAGGKTKMIKKYLPFIPEQVTRYTEPFFGGGAMFLFVKSRFNPKDIVIGDVNADITNIYSSIRDDVSSFLEVLVELDNQFIPLTKEHRKEFFYKLRNEHAWDFRKWNKTEEAASLYYLMKTGFNGIFQLNKNTNGRYGTPSGLLNQKNSAFSKETVLQWHRLLQDVDIVTGSWQQCFDKPKDRFVFLDPPYRGCFTSYGTGFNDNDQLELLEFIESIRSDNNVFLCNRELNDGFFDNTRFTKELFPIAYTAGRRGKNKDGEFEAKSATEILLHNSRNRLTNWYE